MKKISLKIKLVLLIATCMGLAAIGFIGLSVFNQSKVSSILEENSAHIEALEKLNSIQVLFGHEIQEWKNTLLRGANSESYEKHSSSFDKSIEKVLAQSEELKTKFSGDEKVLIEEFIAAQIQLRNDYVSARSQFVNGTVYEPAAADKAVKGKDRKVLDSLNALAKRISEMSEENKIHGQASMAFMFRLSLIGSLVLTSLLLILSYIYANSISNALMKIALLIAHSTEQVDSVGQQLSSASHESSSGATESAASLEQTVSSLEEISSMVKSSAENAKQAQLLAGQSQATAEQGAKEMQDLELSIGKIVESSRKIEEIISIIDDIAFQTNLLALNAAVEAARAGEQGRGFAVVAEAVRNLAHRSADAAKDINSLIHNSVEQIQAGDKKAKSSGVILKSIVESVKKVSDLNQAVSNAAQEQSMGIEQISRAMQTLGVSTQQSAAAAQTVSTSAQDLATQGTQLHGLVIELKNVLEGEGQQTRTSSYKHDVENISSGSYKTAA